MPIRTPTHRVNVAEGVIDVDARQVVIGGESRSLTPTEAALLAFLVQRAGDAVSRDVLLREVWGYNPNVVSRTLDTTVARLRGKIELDPAKPRHLVTAPGVGYRFVPHAPSPDPSGLAPLVGRQQVLDELRLALSDHPPILTISGAGGMGKSHLLRSFCGELGAAVVDLGALDRLVSVPDAVAAALDRVCSPGWRGLGHLLGTRQPPILGLDAFDHLGSRLAEGLAELLAGVDAGPGVTLILATRAPLRVPGERLIELGPLTPEAGRALFHARARGLKPEDEAPVGELVDRLGNIPLAIELAAARCSVLSPAEQLARLDRALDLLVDRAGDGRSLRGSIAGSWSLLSPADQAALRALCVLRSPFSLSTAEAVLGLDTPAALDAVQSLRERSLLSVTQGEDGTRFTFLNPIRWFALEQIPDAAEAERRHARHFGRWSGRRVLDLWALDQGDGAARRNLVAERADLEAAVAWGLREGDVALAGAAWLGFFEATRLGGDADAVAELARLILADDALPDELRADVQPRLADLFRRTGRAREGLALARRSVEQARAQPDPIRLAYALHALACFFQDLGDQLEAERLCTEAIGLARAEGARPIEAASLAIRGNAALARGALDLARADMLSAVDLFRALGNRRAEAVVLGALGNLFHEAGLAEPALQSWAAALAAQRALQDRRGEALVLGNRAMLLLQRGRAEEAEADLRRALLLHEEAHQRRYRAVVMATLADVLRYRGQDIEALTLARASIAAGQEVGWRAAAVVAEAIRGELEARLGTPIEGLNRLIAAEQELTQLGLPSEAAIAACRRARVLLAGGAREEAIALLTPWRGEEGRDTELGFAVRETVERLGPA